MSAKSTIEMLVHRLRIGKFASVGAVGATIETVLAAQSFQSHNYEISPYVNTEIDFNTTDHNIY